MFLRLAEKLAINFLKPAKNLKNDGLGDYSQYMQDVRMLLLMKLDLLPLLPTCWIWPVFHLGVNADSSCICCLSLPIP